MSNIAIQDKEWHHLPDDEITTQLASDREKGLTPEEAGQRLDQFGANALTAKQGQSAWMRFLLQFHQPLIYILIAAGGITAALVDSHKIIQQ